MPAAVAQGAAMTPDQWAEWAAYQWIVIGRTQRSIARDLGYATSATVCTAISQFLTAAFPNEDEDNLGGNWKPLARRYFNGRAEPTAPRTVAFAAALENAGRVFDPDEKTAPRDVWLTYRPGPGFDFMEPAA
ncbi:MAG TPA: hypothetical protein VEW06_06280 [Xanthobacteraceae bacterium]|nr:hypothetical protein [Xanthobacteraceae bacterium]